MYRGHGEDKGLVSRKEDRTETLSILYYNINRIHKTGCVLLPSTVITFVVRAF